MSDPGGPGTTEGDGLDPAEREPEWAEAIRRGRRDRAARLRQVFAAFDEEQGVDPLLPDRPAASPATSEERR